MTFPAVQIDKDYRKKLEVAIVDVLAVKGGGRQFHFSKAARSSFRIFVPRHHGLINYIDTKAKCRHLKKIDM
jgi:hypothetical protein